MRSTLAVFFVAGSLLGLGGLLARRRADPRAGGRGLRLGAVRPARLRRGRARAGAHRPRARSGAWSSASAYWPASPSSPGRRWPSLAGVPTRIEDPADPRLADYVGLTDVALRRRHRARARALHRRVREGHPAGPRRWSPAAVRSSWRERWLTDLADLVERAEADGIPVFVGEHEVIEALTGFHLHRGALAAMQRPVLATLAEVLDGARRVLVLEDVVDHTNVGAVFRSAAALGVDAVLVTPRCADPLYRRSIRVSMGTVFQVPWTRIDPWPGGVAAAARAGLRRGGAGARRRLRGARRAGRGPARAAGPRARHRGRRAVAAGPSLPSTSRCGSRWPAGWTRSTSPPPAPWRAGPCGSREAERWRAHRRLGHPRQRQEHAGVRPRRSPAGSPSSPTPTSSSTTASTRPGPRPSWRQLEVAADRLRAAPGGRRPRGARPRRPARLPRGPGRTSAGPGGAGPDGRGCAR